MRSENAVVNVQINSFNYLVAHHIDQILHRIAPFRFYGTDDTACAKKWRLSKPPNAEHWYVFYLTIHHVQLGTPTVVDEVTGTRTLYPSEARTRELDYVAPLFVTVKLTQKTMDEQSTVREQSQQDVEICKLPIMVRSSVCTLHGMSDDERAAVGECMYDTGGYFILRGKERSIIAHEHMCTNYPVILQSTENMFCLEVRSTEFPGERPTVFQMHARSRGIRATCTIHLLRTTVPVSTLLAALREPSETIDVDAMFSAFIAHAKDECEDVAQALIQIREDMLRMDTGAARLHVQSLVRPVFQASFGWEYVLFSELFPHLGRSALLATKFMYVLYCLERLLRVAYGHRPLDDRDDYALKRLDTCSDLIGNNLFRPLCMQFIKQIAAEVVKRGFELVIPTQAISSFTENILYSFRSSNWGTQRDFFRTGVSQVLSRTGLTSTISQLRRFVTPMCKEVKIVKPRQIHLSQWGYVCVNETPEGSGCGLVKHLTMLADVTLATSASTVFAVLSRIEESIPQCLFPFEALVVVNGILAGTTRVALRLYQELLRARRSQELHRNTSVVWDRVDREIRIWCDSGRIIRPLLVNDTIPASSWHELETNGLLEWIDADEHATLWIANTWADVTPSHTHVELLADSILGVSSALIPFSNHNQAPRNCYQSAMTKQSVGAVALNTSSRFDKIVHYMQYVQRPLCSTNAADFVRTNELPCGQNLIVAILACGGFNQEDSIVVNSSAVDRGLLRSVSVQSISVTERLLSMGSVELIQRPSPEIRRKWYEYRHLDPSGIVYPGSLVKPNDVLVGRVRIDAVNGITTTTDDSVVASIELSGVVQRVCITDNASGRKLVRIQVLNTRIPQIGDKLASTHAQKGSIGMMYPQEDLPFTSEGIVPDIIINPHCMPSRMTIAQLLEAVVSKEACFSATFADGTPFAKFDMERLRSQSALHGIPGLGHERMISGTTGRMLPATVFICPTFYQRLKHMVQDKLHARAFGVVQQLTRQPLEGRSRDGGLRFGEMERDCMIAHGAARFLRERLYTVSDAYSTTVCRRCGILSGKAATAQAECFRCRSEGRLTHIDIPFATKLVIQELAAVNICVRLLEEE